MARKPNPLDDFVIDPAKIVRVGKDLHRPECILAKRDGSLYAGDARGGVLRIAADGTQTLIAPNEAKEKDFVRDHEGLTSGSLPNGMAFAANGDVFIANLGIQRLERLSMAGEIAMLVDSIEGQALGQVNFVLRDSKGRIWLTVSARRPDWMVTLRPDVAEGYIALYENGRLRIVADGLRYTNEIRLDAKEEWLYISETCGPYVSRMRVTDKSELTDHEIFGPSEHAGLTDGIAFDSFGNLWGTHVFTDRVFAITPEGDLKILLDDAPDDWRDFMAAYNNKALTPELLTNCKGKIAPWTTSITFGGPDLSTVYMGNVLGTDIPSFRSPVAGLPMIHWNE